MPMARDKIVNNATLFWLEDNMFFASAFECRDTRDRNRSNVIEMKWTQVWHVATRFIAIKNHVTVSNISHSSVHRVNSATQLCNRPHLCTSQLRKLYTIDFEWRGTRAVIQLQTKSCKRIFEFSNKTSGRAQWSAAGPVDILSILYVAYFYT